MQEQLQFSRRKNILSLLRNICKNSYRFSKRVFSNFHKNTYDFPEEHTPAILNNRLIGCFRYSGAKRVTNLGEGYIRGSLHRGLFTKFYGI